MGQIQLGDGQDWNCGCTVSPLKNGGVWDMTAGLDLGVGVERGRLGWGGREGALGVRGLLSPHFFLLYLSSPPFLFIITPLLCQFSAKDAFYSAFCAATNGGGVVVRYTSRGFRGREYCQRFSGCWEKLASWRYRGNALGVVYESSWE